MASYEDIRSGGRKRRGLSPFAAGIIAILLTSLATYAAFTKWNPFADKYELNAVFRTANDMKAGMLVRVAGVTVGKVKEVKPKEDGSGFAEVRMEIEEEGLPIKKDADLKIRPRLFLEGNYFVDIHPGRPSSRELPDGGWIPAEQTASPVQFGTLLTALQRDTREDLRTFLREYSKALEGSGAKGFNNAIRYWEPAYRNTAIATRASLGQRPGDLQRVLRGQGRAFAALARDEEALKDLVTNLNRTALAFGREDDALKATIPALRDVLIAGRPALAAINRAVPTVRAFARDALPGAISSSPTLDAQLPFIRQARLLVSRNELRGLVADLRPTVPFLIRLNKNNTLSLQQTRALASCQNNVLIPFAKTPIPDPDFPEASGEPWFEVSARTFVGLSGESRLADANSPFFRVQAGAGPTTVASTGEAGERFFGQALFPINGVRPARPSKRPVFRPGVPCETQEPPDLNATRGPGDTSVQPSGQRTRANAQRESRAKKEFNRVLEHLRREARGEPSIDPLSFSDEGERLQARRLGLRRMPDGSYEKKRRPRR